MKNIFLTALFSVISIFCMGAKYYISPSGVTGNTGITSGSPKGTLAQVFAAFNLAANDTIFVAAGTYTETGTTVGTDDEGFVIQGATLDLIGEPTSIFDAASTARWLLLGNTNNDNITINKIAIKDHKNTDGGSPGGGGGIKIIAGCTGFTMNYCLFDNCDTRTSSLQHRGGAIYSAEAVTIKYSTFRNCNAEYYGGAISIELAPASNSVISYCKFYSNNCSNYGTSVFYGVSTVKSLTITNCLFYENGNSSGEAVIVGMNSSSTINIMNCTITKNGNASTGTGGVLAVSSSKVYVVNSIIYANLGTTYNDAYNNSSTMTFTNCLYGNASEINSVSPNTSPTIGNPSFVDATNDDYHLLSASVAINKGTLTGAPTNDLDLATRTDNPDVGAYEFIPVSLPIELLYFKGLIEDNTSNRLYWSTASESNNDFFTVEKSMNGSDWEIVDRQSGAGNSSNQMNYYTLDRNVERTINYYKLTQTDYDGRFKYSEIISMDNRMNSEGKRIDRTTNILGQEVDLMYYRGLVIIYYTNGSSEKIIK